MCFKAICNGLRFEVRSEVSMYVACVRRAPPAVNDDYTTIWRSPCERTHIRCLDATLLAETHLCLLLRHCCRCRRCCYSHAGKTRHGCGVASLLWPRCCTIPSRVIDRAGGASRCIMACIRIACEASQAKHSSAYLGVP
jgi:hypothetical protein